MLQVLYLCVYHTEVVHWRDVHTTCPWQCLSSAELVLFAEFVLFAGFAFFLAKFALFVEFAL